MTDTRNLQRTLLRMQLDPGLGRALRAGDEEAWRSTSLDETDRALLLEAPAAGIDADPEGKRRSQVLGNATAEYLVTLAHAARHDAGFLASFASSDELHAALAKDVPLPLAFADYAARCVEDWSDASLRGTLALESALARRRRAHRLPSQAAAVAPLALAAGEVRLNASAELVELTAGTLDRVDAERLALSEGRALPASDAGEPGARELVLVQARGELSPHRLAELHVERLAAPVDELLLLAREPLGRERRAAFARECGAEPEDLESFVEGLVGDGILERA